MALIKNSLYTNGMPGRNWDVLNTRLDSTVIAEMERDAIAMLKYLANNPGQAGDSWLFPYGLVGLLGDTNPLCEQFCDKLRLSDSWILNVTRLYVTAVQVRTLQIAMEVLSGKNEPETPLCDFFRKVDLRPAQNDKENEMLDALIAVAPKLLQLSTVGLESYRYRN